MSATYTHPKLDEIDADVYTHGDGLQAVVRCDSVHMIFNTPELALAWLDAAYYAVSDAWSLTKIDTANVQPAAS